MGVAGVLSLGLRLQFAKLRFGKEPRLRFEMLHKEILPKNREARV